MIKHRICAASQPQNQDYKKAAYRCSCAHRAYLQLHPTEPLSHIAFACAPRLPLRLQRLPGPVFTQWNNFRLQQTLSRTQGQHLQKYFISLKLNTQELSFISSGTSVWMYPKSDTSWFTLTLPLHSCKQRRVLTEGAMSRSEQNFNYSDSFIEIMTENLRANNEKIFQLFKKHTVLFHSSN